MARQVQHTRVPNVAGAYEDASGKRFDIVSNTDSRISFGNIRLYKGEGFEPLVYDFVDGSADAYAVTYGLTIVAGEDSSPIVQNYDVVLSTLKSYFVPIGVTGTLVGIVGALQAAITLADENITFKDNGGTLLTDSALVVANAASAGGDIVQSAPSANNVFGAGDFLEIIVAGDSTTASALSFSLIFSSTSAV